MDQNFGLFWQQPTIGKLATLFPKENSLKANFFPNLRQTMTHWNPHCCHFRHSSDLQFELFAGPVEAQLLDPPGRAERGAVFPILPHLP